MVPFLTMRHGFLTRGDISDPEVAAEVENIQTSGVPKVEKCPHIAPCITLLLGVQSHECHSGLH